MKRQLKNILTGLFLKTRDAASDIASTVVLQVHYGGICNEQPLWLISGKQWSLLFHDPVIELDHESISDSLRDALFDMIKWLKTNKLI